MTLIDIVWHIEPMLSTAKMKKQDKQGRPARPGALNCLVCGRTIESKIVADKWVRQYHEHDSFHAREVGP
jgi:hypothetical protein